MREHMGLYRGKRRDNGEWAEGWLVIKTDSVLEITYCFILAQGKGESFVTWYPVDPDTVGECTGLRDKNGKLIFEGDILHVGSYACDYDFKTSVGPKYGYSSALYVDGEFDGGDLNEIGFAFDYWREDNAEVEIIGNIHDNPGAAKGESNG